MATSQPIPEYLREIRQMGDPDPSSWLNKSEVPSSEEINDPDDEYEIEVPVNKVAGQWVNKQEYLKSHHLLLREDGVSSLRNAVSEVRNEPHIMERDSQEDAAIYENVYRALVHIIGFKLAISGLVVRISFSLRRLGKRVLWEQSKRLLPGSLVALTPAKDMFKSVCRIATVAARPLSNIQLNPPEIDLFWARPEEIEMDPLEEWVMVESRIGYFEAYRHTLRSLQKMAFESFPLSGHLVNAEPEIQPPSYLEHQPFKDLSLLYAQNSDNYLNVDVMHNWPLNTPPTLDTSQFEALRRILTKQLAIVQGPPGTGKTHVSVVALELLLRNMSPHDPPIILAAHTNHAVDQLLRHVSRFEPDFIRLGGMTTDMEKIRPRTIFEVRNTARLAQDKLKPPSLARQKNVGQEIKQLLAPFDSEEPFSAHLFKQYGVITETQFDSLEKGAAEWVRVEESEQIQGTIAMWLGRELAKADARSVPEDFGFEFEEIEFEFEQLKELEAEAKIDDENMDSIRGEQVTLKELFTGRKSTRGVTEELVKAALEKQDMWKIEESLRGAVYRSLQQRLKDAMRRSLRGLAKAYEETVQDIKCGRWGNDAKILRKTRIIGMTTTGLSKYRGLIQSLSPKIVLIEEAAETLEAYVTAACFPSLEHLILVGDHQQLRGHCTVKELEGHPWFLDVSMFERLVRNQVGFSQMITQRRMIPEIRRALKPIYEDLIDHESVLNRPSIPGMGGTNTFFFSHEWPESSDHQMSKVNPEEANMITNFFFYLVQNGTAVENITVLTFYNGQRKLITKTLRAHHGLQGFRFNVATVDSFQGEENDIILLSLARNNPDRKIGFLEVENRVCVALSRAQRGFYIFGNALMLSQASPLWWEVVQAMGRDPTRVGFTLTLTCQTHGEEVYITEPRQFSALSGGCERICEVKLSCGHPCNLNCHAFSHDLVQCKFKCNKILECGHECQQPCGKDCGCSCNDVRGRGNIAGRISTPPPQSESSPKRALPITEEGRPFREYAEGGHKESDANLDAIGTNKLVNVNESDQGVVGDVIPVVNGRQAMKLVRTTSEVDGTKRGVWKGTWVGNQNSKEKELGQDPEINVDWKEERRNSQVEDTEKGEGEESEEDLVVDDKPEDSSKQDEWMVQASLLD